MTHLVISQTWLHAREGSFASYLDLVERYDEFLRAQPGFVSRRLVRSLDDPTHVFHLREFESVSHYEAMTELPEYRAQIAALSELVDGSAYPPGAVPREYGEIVVDTIPS